LRLTHNLHVHSVVSNCAKREMLIPEIAREAERCGLETVAIVDHIDVPEDPAREALVASNSRIIEELDTPVRLLAGTETTVVAPGRPAVSERTRRGLDIVLLALNHYHLSNVEHPAERSPRAYADHHLLMIRAAAPLPYVDVIVHPFLHAKIRGLDQREVLDAYDPHALRDALAAMADHGVRLEISPGHILTAPDFFREVVGMGRQVGLRFTIGTDAHRLADLCYAHGVVPLLESIGLKDSDIALPERVSRRAS
jgi:histidinol phosphatase-like PHP family hydrolase